jgi:hypothetical protein
VAKPSEEEKKAPATKANPKKRKFNDISSEAVVKPHEETKKEVHGEEEKKGDAK